MMTIQEYLATQDRKSWAAYRKCDRKYRKFKKRCLRTGEDKYSFFGGIALVRIGDAHDRP